MKTHKQMAMDWAESGHEAARRRGIGPYGRKGSVNREAVQVTYYPVLKNQALGRRMTRTISALRGENPVKAAERALAECYKVRDYVIFDAHLAQTETRV